MKGTDHIGGVQRALLWAYGQVERTGLLRTRPGRAAFEAAYWVYKSTLEARDLATLRPFVAPGSTVVDVGANIGFFATRFAQWVGSEGRVVAIEPEPANFASLERRVRRRGLEDRFVLVRAAAVESPGEVFLELNPGNPADHRVGATGLPVPATSIDALIAQHRLPAVSLIKIDVQGAELKVLRGARESLSRFRPALHVEFAEELLELGGTSADEVLDELTAIGYTPAILDEKGSWADVDRKALLGRIRDLGYLDVLLRCRDTLRS